MLKKMISWLKKAVNNLIPNSKIKNVTGLDTSLSDTMQSMINSWFKVFMDKPSWKQEDWKLINLMAIATKEMATLCICELNIDVTGNQQKADFITDQLDRFVYPNLKNTMQNCFIGGSVILKPFLDKQNLKCEVVKSTSFYPIRYDIGGSLETVIFTDTVKNGEKQYIKLEYQELQQDGVLITNRAFKYDGAIGKEVPLTLIPEWADLEPEIKINNVDRLLIGYFKTSGANNIDGSRTPVSIVSGSLEIMAELDRIYNEYLYEIHSGKRRLIVDSTTLKRDGSGNIVKPDDLDSDTVFLQLDLTEGNKPFEDYTPEIRTEHYQRAIDLQLRLFEIKTGFSAGTFNFDVKSGRVTATQIISEDKTTYNTCKDLQAANKSAFVDLIYAYSVLCDLYKLTPTGKVAAVISFGDSIFEDTATEYMRRLQMANSGYLRPELLLSWYFGTTEEQAKKMLPEPSLENLDFAGGR